MKEKNLMNKLINVAIASSKIQFIQLPVKKIRGNIHVILYGKVGIGKSTILKEISEKLNYSIMGSLTKASLMGTVDRDTGIFIPPIPWTSRNGLILVDEFNPSIHNHKEDLLNTLLTLMEFPELEKPIGYRCNEVNEFDEDLFCKVKDGRIRYKTRFSFFSTTMRHPNTLGGIYADAFKSRCIIINFQKPVDKIYYSIHNKDDSYIYKHYKVKPNYKMKKKELLYIEDYIRSSNFKIKEEFILRTFGDFCRVFCVLNKHDPDIYDYILSSRCD